jgi:hypothetical protein
MTKKQKETNDSIARILRIFGIISILAGIALGFIVGTVDDDILTAVMIVSAGIAIGLFEVWMAQVLCNQGYIIDSLNSKN